MAAHENTANTVDINTVAHTSNTGVRDNTMTLTVMTTP
jgi:hypothetical protein